jgi:iron complex outermembrane receptor protein
MTKIKYTEAYSLLDIKASYTFTILKMLKTELSNGINNAGNTKVASILPNAVGFETHNRERITPEMELLWRLV